jgi:hypothetical protein
MNEEQLNLQKAAMGIVGIEGTVKDISRKLRKACDQLEEFTPPNFTSDRYKYFDQLDHVITKVDFELSYLKDLKVVLTSLFEDLDKESAKDPWHK